MTGPIYSPEDVSLAVQVAQLDGTVRGYAELTEHRLTSVERDLKGVRVDVDKLLAVEARRTGRTGLLIGLASVGTGLATTALGPLVAAFLY